MRLILSALLLFAFLPAPIAAQTRPDFSGTWIEDERQRQRKPPSSPAPAGPGSQPMSGPPPAVVITQADDRITIERTSMSMTNRMTYTFDGKENVNRQGAQTHTTRTRWDGARLVTEGDVYQITSHGEDEWKIREVRSLTPKGEMVLESTRIGDDGKEVVVVRVFRRK